MMNVHATPFYGGGMPPPPTTTTTTAANGSPTADEEHPAVDLRTTPLHEPSWDGADPSSDPAPGTAGGDEQNVLVVDPITTKLRIPMQAVVYTQALSRVDRVPSICMLYLAGRCRQGAACHQLHADPGVVEGLRAQANSRLSCCPHHGEEVGQRNLQQLLPRVDGLVLEGSFISSSRVATTNGMRRLLVERQPSGPITSRWTVVGTPATPTSEDSSTSTSPRGGSPCAARGVDKTVIHVLLPQVCRLHMSGRCRSGEDCNFIHLCHGLSTLEEEEAGKDFELAKLLSRASTNAVHRSATSQSNSRQGRGGSAVMHTVPRAGPMIHASGRFPLPFSTTSPTSLPFPHGDSRSTRARAPPPQGIFQYHQDQSFFLPSEEASPGSSPTRPGDGGVLMHQNRPAWRHAPYSWEFVSPVRRAPPMVLAAGQ